jgi:hypothetical protein
MAEQEAGGFRLGRTRRRLERWRERYGGPGQAIPQEFWDEAVAVARVEGVDATARALRLDRGRLERRMASSGSGSDERGIARGGFVELDARGLCAVNDRVEVKETGHLAGGQSGLFSLPPSLEARRDSAA